VAPTSHAGLGLIGRALNECTNPAAEANAVLPSRSDAMSHASILSSYIALLCLAKSDFEVVNGFREDAYFAEVLGLDPVPSGGCPALTPGCPGRRLQDGGGGGGHRASTPQQCAPGV